MNLSVAAAAVLAHIVLADIKFLGAAVAHTLAIADFGVAKDADHLAYLVLQRIQKHMKDF